MREMKDSGIEWIGEIPEDWKINSMFQLFTQVKNKNYTLSETNLLSLSYGKIKRKNINTTDGLLPQSFDTYNIVQKNDIVLRLTDLQNDHKSLRVGISNEQGIITSAYVTLRNRTNNLSQYLYYYLHSFDVAKGFYGMGSGVRQGLTWDDLKLFKFVIPSQKEQQKISAYLDRKCTEIDSVISKTKATIEEYKKLKQSVITQAVTKGIIPNRPMKDSGIEWIGEIPQEWKTSKIKYVADFQPICDTSRLNAESIITYTPMEYIKNGYYIENTAIFSSVSSSLTPYCEGDIVIAKVTPCFENGNIAIMNNLSSGFGMGSSELFVLRAKNIKKEFLFYWLQNQNFIKIACSTMTGTGGLKRVSSQFVRNSMLCLPSKNEQQEIANYLDEKCTEIDKLIAKKEQLLTEMENYKKAVIYEYVTGKKEVE